MRENGHQPRFGMGRNERVRTQGRQTKKDYTMPETIVSYQTWSALKSISKDRGVPIFTICREAFDQYVERADFEIPYTNR